MTMNPFERTDEFSNDFLIQAQHAKKRIWIQVMFFDPGSITKPFEDALIAGAKRGLDVRLTVDWVTNKYFGGNLLLLPPLHKKDRDLYREVNQQRKALFDRLSQAGVTLTTTNIPFFHKRTLPMLGRNHTKIFLIDDTAVWLGGVNIAEIMYTNEDFMVRFSRSSIIEAVADQFLKVNENTPTYDYKVECDKENTLLVDSGKPGKSLILNEAYEGILSAKKEIVFVSQLVPDGKLLSALCSKAKQGIDVTVITSSKTDLMVSTFPYNITYKLFILATKDIKTIRLYHNTAKMHSKLLLVDSNVAFFGSHNFVFTGVLFGTQEICMKTIDKHIVYDLVKYSKNLIDNSKKAS